MTAPKTIAGAGIGQRDEGDDRQRAREIDDRQDVALRQAFCSQPTPSEPMMLNRPITASVQPPIWAERPRSTR